MVGWSQNQYFTYDKNSAPSTPATVAGAPSSFFTGSGSPAPASSFPSTSGQTPAFSFSTSGTAPAPSSPFSSTSTGGLFGQTQASTGGHFGSTPAPTPAGGSLLFGSSTSSPGGFFGTPAPSTTGGVFGAPSTSTSGTFPVAQPPPAVQGIPAQAAIRTFMDETARQEAVKLQSVTQNLYNGFTGGRFTTILYDELNAEQRNYLFAMTLATGSREPPVPPKPPHVSERDWIDACARNPDPNLYVPVALVGNEALQTRLASQQTQTRIMGDGVRALQNKCQFLRDRHEQVDVRALTDAHALLRQRLLDVMCKVELVRGRGMPMRRDEAKLARQLHELSLQVSRLSQHLAQLKQQRSVGAVSTLHARVLLPDKTELYHVLTDQRKALETVSEVCLNDEHDLSLLKTKLLQHGNRQAQPRGM